MTSPLLKPTPMSDPVANQVISEMVRADLELAWNHLENVDYDLAIRELHNAEEKILQLKALDAPAVEATQQRLPTITLDEPFHDTRPDPKISS